MRALRQFLMAWIGAVAALLLAGCEDEADPAAGAPPRATDAIVFPQEPSQVAVDLRVDLADLERALEREVPRQLWTINRPDTECIAPKKIDLELFKVKSPKIKCDITGKATRGRLRLSGSGEVLRVTLPVTGTIAARDVAGIFKGETATGTADVTLSLRLDLNRDWRLVSDTRLDYRWTREPGIDFAGQRITFTSEADRELRPVKRDVERIVARELAKLPVRQTAAEGWEKAHKVFILNERNPEVWGRITPQQFRFGGYQVAGRELVLSLGLDALMESFVGMKPEPAEPSPLPPLAARDKAAKVSRFHVPVIADYDVLEPEIAQALAKRSRRPFAIDEYGSVTAGFSDITVYGTGDGRIAVGGKFSASSDLPVVEAAKGTIWLTARPVTEPDSRMVRFADVRVSGSTDLVGESFLFALANSPEFQSTITDALAQSFEKDFRELREKIDRALAARESRHTQYSITIDEVRTGTITAHGAGLYMPVDMTARVKARLRRLN
ncbi:DUF4403 family protein [Porphyrobacter sp. YT40]|uniref:DUF4403 family protein n=1 Tax=Porphyrobacter sp. YT40 TaxID=2547601 RepID=UPI0011431483|nr:DUF4403 family protein [Porphyrobacter sp. YT40]QDH34566.1 DUF4403 family protein [Porphyrobacter sp. YT40]